MHYTNIEQSKKLLELGLNPNSADIFIPCYRKDDYAEDRPYFREHVTKPDKGDLPCWSVEALLGVMPKLHLNAIGDFYPHLAKHKTGKYICVYVQDEHGGSGEWCFGNTLIESAYNMMVWLLENGYIEKSWEKQ